MAWPQKTKPFQLNSTNTLWSAAAKTGTAEVAGKEDMAWFSCYAPYDNPQFAMCVCVEEGGSGGSVAAPLAGQIMDAAIQSAAGTLEEDMSALQQRR